MGEGQEDVGGGANVKGNVPLMRRIKKRLTRSPTHALHLSDR